MHLQSKPSGQSRKFAIIFVLGAAGAGKGTLSTYLAQKHNLVHYSEDLNPFIYRPILDAINRDGRELNGILIDGYPRCIEQLNSFRAWPFQYVAPLAPGSDGKVSLDIKPDLVLSFQVLKHNARERYLSPARDNNDSVHKFEKRFTEYQVETVPVEDEHRRRGVLVPVDFNETKEENIQVITKALQESELWEMLSRPSNERLHESCR
ncbi:uncharacterized protein FIESC28_01098 [Fusarium coffeatum]|uniref:Adenylate kinase active site lid domain-containing protein n=1 Tax=Fusarium coffeatum TaxID=231269 RepID=A0A366SBH4_9HYPO|nr:uncharacterized protein FIESC28_01098 [Fusarium coffeatum]RBR26070.1 hypothetical protein FIESC28_01098 [Fusarium coffeatum]